MGYLVQGPSHLLVPLNYIFNDISQFQIYIWHQISNLGSQENFYELFYKALE